MNVTTENIFTVGNETVVQCSSTHLTSFAVLVNVAGVEVSMLPPCVRWVGMEQPCNSITLK